MPKGKKHLRDCLGERLRKQFDYVATNAEATCQEFQKGDNKQGQEHCKAVEKNLQLLIPDFKKECSLNEVEIFVLLAAAHLHDIGKVEGPNRFGWKSEHVLRDVVDQADLLQIQGHHTYLRSLHAMESGVPGWRSLRHKLHLGAAMIRSLPRGRPASG